MAETHEPVDNMIRAASGDCHGANLKNLEQEVDIIKTSIMRLLMDIRERMNDLENPYTLAGSGSDGVVPDGAPDPDVDISDARKSALNAREAALDAKELEMDATKAKLDAETRNESQKNQPEHGAPRLTEIRRFLMTGCLHCRIPGLPPLISRNPCHTLMQTRH